MPSKKQRLTFEEWYANLIEYMPQKSKGSKKHGIAERGIQLWDRDIAEQDYNNGLTPGQSANRFRKQDMEDDLWPHEPDKQFEDDE